MSQAINLWMLSGNYIWLLYSFNLGHLCSLFGSIVRLKLFLLACCLLDIDDALNLVSNLQVRGQICSRSNMRRTRVRKFLLYGFRTFCSRPFKTLRGGSQSLGVTQCMSIMSSTLQIELVRFFNFSISYFSFLLYSSFYYSYRTPLTLVNFYIMPKLWCGWLFHLTF